MWYKKGAACYFDETYNIAYNRPWYFLKVFFDFYLWAWWVTEQSAATSYIPSSILSGSQSVWAFMYVLPVSVWIFFILPKNMSTWVGGLAMLNCLQVWMHAHERMNNEHGFVSLVHSFIFSFIHSFKLLYSCQDHPDPGNTWLQVGIQTGWDAILLQGTKHTHLHSHSHLGKVYCSWSMFWNVFDECETVEPRVNMHRDKRKTQAERVNICYLWEM